MTPKQFIALELKRMEAMEAKLTEQFRRQDEWRARNPQYAEDWEKRWGPDMNPAEARKHIELAERKAA